jgi:hypothetical protein
MTDLCRHFDAMIARAPQLTAEEAGELEAHLAGCRGCRGLRHVRCSHEPVPDHPMLVG